MAQSSEPVPFVLILERRDIPERAARTKPPTSSVDNERSRQRPVARAIPSAEVPLFADTSRSSLAPDLAVEPKWPGSVIIAARPWQLVSRKKGGAWHTPSKAGVGAMIVKEGIPSSAAARSSHIAPCPSTFLDRWALSRIQAFVKTAPIRFVLWDGFELPLPAGPPVA